MNMKTILPLLLITALSAAVEPLPRASYYKDGEIHITVLGQPETKAITSGHWDFKPSWSITGDHLVFFRRLKGEKRRSVSNIKPASNTSSPAARFTSPTST
jgi:hypothetical protein